MQWGASSSQRHLAPLWIKFFWGFFLYARVFVISLREICVGCAARENITAGERWEARLRQKEKELFGVRQSPWKPPLPRQSSSPAVKNCNGCIRSIDRVFETHSIRRAHAALGNDQIGHPSVSTLGCLLKSPRSHLIGRAERQFSSHDSRFASDCGIFFFSCLILLITLKMLKASQQKPDAPCDFTRSHRKYRRDSAGAFIAYRGWS